MIAAAASCYRRGRLVRGVVSRWPAWLAVFRHGRGGGRGGAGRFMTSLKCNLGVSIVRRDTARRGPPLAKPLARPAPGPVWSRSHNCPTAQGAAMAPRHAALRDLHPRKAAVRPVCASAEAPTGPQDMRRVLKYLLKAQFKTRLGPKWFRGGARVSMTSFVMKAFTRLSRPPSSHPPGEV